MKSILVISNTYYQLITAIRLKETLWNKEKVDIVISDQSNNSEKVAENLKKLNFFQNVWWIKTKNICQGSGNIYLKLKRWKYVTCGIYYPEITAYRYDEIVYYNADIFVYGIFSKLIKINRQLICSRYEEGILSYSDSQYLNNSRLKYANILRRFLYKKTLEQCTSDFYCFYPQLYAGKLNAKAIPQIRHHEGMAKKLKTIFNINDNMLKINEKYIFFSGVFDFEGGEPIGEFELIIRIAELVGKENLIVKLHPRDRRKKFEEKNIKIYEYSSIPWEAIQLNCDFSEKIFLTVNSGSILGANMMLKNRVRSYFLYKCCNFDKNSEASAYIKNVEQFLNDSDSILDQIYILENIEKLSEICHMERA